MTRPSAGTERAAAPDEVRLYEKWKKLYPLWVTGWFQKLRRALLLLLLLIFYASPWITWNGQQCIWLDIPGRKFTIAWTTFYPQEFVLLSWLLMIAAFALFFFTAIAGRLWCGYACPQTIWTLCYQWIEKCIEGERNQRLKLDRGPWNGKRIRIKLFKWALWSLLALSIGFTFVGYFVPPLDLLRGIAGLGLGGWETFWLLFPAGASFLFSGVLREQVCLHMCPYARFQSVMFDKDTLVIHYDDDRGEPRGSRGRRVDPASRGLGSCIDCRLCVHACPTGIDIRDGLQYQCIGCAQCIDVCNSVMQRMGYSPDLIRYSSQHQDRHERSARIRPRLVGYGAFLAAMVLTFAVSVANRIPLELDIIRDRNRLYREHWDGTVENVYTLKIMNRERTSRTYRLSASGELFVELRSRREGHRITVAAGGHASLPVELVTTPMGDAATNKVVYFTVETVGSPSFRVIEESRFITPAAAPVGRQP